MTLLIERPEPLAPSLRQMLDAAEGERAELQSFAPKPKTADGEQVPTMVGPEAPSDTYTFFIKGGEEIASVMERNAQYFEDRAKDYRRLAQTARDAAQKTAERADAHEQKFAQVLALADAAIDEH